MLLGGQATRGAGADDDGHPHTHVHALLPAPPASVRAGHSVRGSHPHGLPGVRRGGGPRNACPGRALPRRPIMCAPGPCSTRWAVIHLPHVFEMLRMFDVCSSCCECVAVLQRCFGVGTSPRACAVLWRIQVQQNITALLRCLQQFMSTCNPLRQKSVYAFLRCLYILALCQDMSTVFTQFRAVSKCIITPTSS